LRLLTAFVALSASAAFASAVYPSEVKTHLSLSSTPQCTLCHTNLSGGSGTVTKPFGKSMMSVGGLTGGSQTGKLDTALDALQSAGTDSDSDGVPDITELKNGTDPNVADAATDGGTGGGAGGSGGGGGTVATETYGCGSSMVPGVMGLSSLVAWTLLRRRRAS
jgi:hypothetical protein